jgi:hypothetical protein
MSRYFLITIALLLTLSACGKSKSESAVKLPNIDACALIKNDEIQSIQGAPVTNAKGSAQSDSRFRIAQCFYNTEPFNKSVSLAVTQSDPASPSARDPKEFWNQTFGVYEKQTGEQKGDEEAKKKSLAEEEERGRPPKKIQNVGDEAFWSASRVGGALYVLKNHVFIRISVGGPESEDARIEKSKALAAKAISRL